MKCSVEGCGRSKYGRDGLCLGHYQQKRQGKELRPIRQGTHGMSLQDKVRFYSVENPATGCWEWQAYKKPSGYGTLWYDGKPYYHAHRVSYIAFNGPIPEGMWVLHICDVRCCVNPQHLRLGSMQDNVDDRNQKRRQATGERVGTAKLTWEQVRSIKSQMATTTDKKLAKWFDVSPTTIANIRKGVSWKGNGPTTAA